MQLGNESDIHNGLKKAKESMDVKVEEAYNRSLAKSCAEAAVKALSSGSSSSKSIAEGEGSKTESRGAVQRDEALSKHAPG